MKNHVPTDASALQQIADRLKFINDNLIRLNETVRELSALVSKLRS